MRIEKIKNFIIITNYENKTNKIDINTSQILGKKGTQVKNLSPDIKQFLYQEVYRSDSHDFNSYINALFDFPENNELLRFVDKMCALGLRIRRYDMQDIIRNLQELNAIKYDKKLVAFLKNNNDGKVQLGIIRQFAKYSFLSEEDFELFSQFGFSDNGFEFANQNAIQKFIEWYKYLVEHEYIKMFERNISLNSLIRDYLTKCKDLEKEEVYTKNFLLNWCRVTKEHELNKAKFLNKKIREYQENKNLEYSTEVFTVIVPMTYEELKDESDQQSNCIARAYTDYITSGRTNIVFIRLNNNLKKSYLSLEVRDNQVRQALRQHNQQPNRQDWVLVQEYQTYLNTIKK